MGNDSGVNERGSLLSLPTKDDAQYGRVRTQVLSGKYCSTDVSVLNTCSVSTGPKGLKSRRGGLVRSRDYKHKRKKEI